MGGAGVSPTGAEGAVGSTAGSGMADPVTGGAGAGVGVGGVSFRWSPACSFSAASVLSSLIRSPLSKPPIGTFAWDH